MKKSCPNVLNSLAIITIICGLLLLSPYGAITQIAESKQTLSQKLQRQILLIKEEIAEKRYDKARSILEQALKKYEDIADLHKLKAKLLHIKGKTQDALDYLSQMIVKHPNSADYIFIRGEFLYELGYMESAKQDLYRALDLEANFTPIYHYLAGIELQHHNPEQALSHFKAALNNDPVNHDIWYDKARLEYQLDNFEEAHQSCVRAIRLDADNPSYHELLVVILSNLNDRDALEDHLKYMVKKFPNNLWASLNLVSVYIQKKEIKKAHQLLQLLRKRHPEEISILYYMGDILAASGKLKEAVVMYQKILELKPDHTEVKIQLAKIYLISKDMGLAEKYLASAVEEDTQDPFVYEKLAQIYIGHEDTFSAEKIIIKGLQIDKKNIALILEYAGILTKRNKLAKAVAAYEQALVLDNENYRILGNLGELYRLTGKIKEAEDAIRQALVLEPNSPWVRILKIELLHQENKIDKALDEIEKLIRLDPQNRYAYQKKAIILLANKEYQKAYQAVEQALQSEPSLLSLGILKASILSQQGKYKESAETFKEVLVLMPRNSAVLTRMGYAQLHISKERALKTIRKSLNEENFDMITLELYLYLSGIAHEMWGITEDSDEFTTYLDIIYQRYNQAETGLASLEKNKSPHTPYLVYLRDLVKGSEKTSLKTQDSVPDHPWLMFYEGMSASKNNEAEKAMALFEKIIQTRPDLFWVKIKLAVLYEGIKKYHKAIDYINAYLLKRPDSYWAKIRLAINYDFTKQTAKAEEIYLKILESNANDSLSLNNLAWLYLTTDDEQYKKVDTALKLAKKAVRLNANSENLDTLAEAYFQKKMYKEALRAIEQALDKDRQNRDYFKKQKKKIQSAMSKER